MHRTRLLIALALTSLFAALTLGQEAASPQEICDAQDAVELSMMQFDAPDDVLAADVDYRAIFCTSAGAIYVDLYEAITPVTVNNFVFLTGQGYYDSTTFHRVIPNFMAQGGDPTATGRGGPGYKFGDEAVGWLTFDRPGLLAMANAGPGTNGSQFFITTAPTPHLNYKHTIFGDVLAGQDIVESIRERDPSTATEMGEALQSVIIISDLDQVDNSAFAALESASPEQISAAFDAFSGSLPPTLPTNADTSGLFTADQLTASVAADLQDAYAEYADQHGLQYRRRAEVDNVDCSAGIYFTALGYQVDVFESASAAAAAMSDDLTSRILAGQGYQPLESSVNSYSREIPTCADEPGVQTLSLYRYGRYLVSVDVLVAQGVLEQAGVTGALVLADLSRQIEPAFADIYRQELR